MTITTFLVELIFVDDMSLKNLDCYAKNKCVHSLEMKFCMIVALLIFDFFFIMIINLGLSGQLCSAYS